VVLTLTNALAEQSERFTIIEVVMGMMVVRLGLMECWRGISTSDRFPWMVIDNFNHQQETIATMCHQIGDTPDHIMEDF